MRYTIFFLVSRNNIIYSYYDSLCWLTCTHFAGKAVSFIQKGQLNKMYCRPYTNVNSLLYIDWVTFVLEIQLFWPSCINYKVRGHVHTPRCCIVVCLNTGASCLLAGSCQWTYHKGNTALFDEQRNRFSLYKDFTSSDTRVCVCYLLSFHSKLCNTTQFVDVYKIQWCSLYLLVNCWITASFVYRWVYILNTWNSI